MEKIKIDSSTLRKLCSPSLEEMNLAFSLIFKKYRYLVYYVSFDILKNEEEAKDIVDEAFMKMYERRGTFSNETGLKYFLLVTAKNLSINRWNQRKDHLPYSDDIEGQDDQVDISPYLEKFKGILDKEEYRYLVLHVVYGFSFKEIAKSSNLTTSQVSSKYRRGIKKLRDFYGGSEDGQG